MEHLRLNPPLAFMLPFCHAGELNSSLIDLPSISVLLQEFNASLASSVVGNSTNAYLFGEEDFSQPGSTRDPRRQVVHHANSGARHNLPFRPALVVLWHLDGRSFLKQFLESLF